MEVIILMNNFIRIQICINVSRQANVSAIYCKNALSDTKQVAH